MDRRYDLAAEIAAHICNLLAGDMPKAERFGRILFLILDGFYEAERGQFDPSDN
jgi:hypothetical protein